MPSNLNPHYRLYRFMLDRYSFGSSTRNQVEKDVSRIAYNLDLIQEFYQTYHERASVQPILDKIEELFPEEVFLWKLTL